MGPTNQVSTYVIYPITDCHITIPVFRKKKNLYRFYIDGILGNCCSKNLAGKFHFGRNSNFHKIKKKRKERKKEKEKP